MLVLTPELPDSQQVFKNILLLYWQFIILTEFYLHFDISWPSFRSEGDELAPVRFQGQERYVSGFCLKYNTFYYAYVISISRSPKPWLPEGSPPDPAS